MSEDYRKMWSELGMNLEAHDGLMSVLGQFYGDIYLSRKNRPDAMSYFDNFVSEIHGARVKELVDARKNGKKVVGAFCVYVPEELTLAAGAIQVGLCAGADVGGEAVERIMPRNTCALIKAFVGFKLSGICPYIEVSDFVVGETTCDGKKKVYEIFSKYVPMYIMEIPQMKNEADRILWKSEIQKYKDKLEEITGNKITPEKLREAIKIVNDRRIALQRLNKLRAASPVPVSGLDVLLINQLSFLDEPVRFTRQVNLLCDELEKRIKEGIGVFGEDTPRVMIAGCPMAIPNWKIHHIIETSGAAVIGEESCTGTRNTDDLTEEEFSNTDEMMEVLVDRYMKINCACFTPNEARITQIKEMAENIKADGVINYTISFCQTYAFEAFMSERALSEDGIPVYNIETDYSMEDVPQLKTRLEAFIEMVKSEKKVKV